MITASTVPNLPAGVVRRIDLLVVWGRAIAHAVGYTNETARPLGLAYASRLTDPRARQPRAGFPFAGYLFERFEQGEQIGFTAHGPVRWAADYDEVKKRIGPQHDELLALAADVLEGQPMGKLDRSCRGAEVLHQRLSAIGVAASSYHRIRIALVLDALRR